MNECPRSPTFYDWMRRFLTLYCIDITPWCFNFKFQVFAHDEDAIGLLRHLPHLTLTRVRAESNLGRRPDDQTSPQLRQVFVRDTGKDENSAFVVWRGQTSLGTR